MEYIHLCIIKTNNHFEVFFENFKNFKFSAGEYTTHTYVSCIPLGTLSKLGRRRQ